MPVSANEVLSVIAQESGLAQEALRPDATFDELDIGSIDVASALFAIEDKFGVVVDPEALSPTSTISDFVALVTRLAAA